MKGYLRFGMLISALLSATLACSLGDLVGGDSLPPDVLFQDDFSDPSSGWDQVVEDEGMTDYVDGAYRIFVNTNSTDVWANPGLNFMDVVIEVDATKVGGPNDNDYGLICRYKDDGNFYFFIIGSDQSYGVGIVKEGGQDLLSEKPMGYSEYINPGNASNHIRAHCIGSQLSLYVNDEKLVEVADSSFESGDVGLLAGTFEEPGTDIHFDNYLVKEP